jgi:Anti-sigma-K factor rskA
MLSETEIQAAHPDAFDFVFGNLPSARRAEFNRHLSGCRHCQSVVDEYADIGQIIRQLPPHVEPPAELEDRTITAMIEARANEQASAEPQPDTEDQSATQLHPRPAGLAAAEPETRLYPIPGPSAEPDTKLHPRPAAVPSAEPEATARPMVTPLPVWRRYRGRLAAAGAAAAAIIAAAVAIPLSLGGGGITPALAGTVVTPLHVTTAAKVIGDGGATAQVTARQVGASWTFVMKASGLKVLPDKDNEVYECWWVGPGSTKAHPMLVSGGTFVVGASGSATLTMTTGVDPHQFRTMVITVESPGTGASTGAVLLTGQSTT